MSGLVVMPDKTLYCLARKFLILPRYRGRELNQVRPNFVMLSESNSPLLRLGPRTGVPESLGEGVVVNLELSYLRQEFILAFICSIRSKIISSPSRSDRR